MDILGYCNLGVWLVFWAPHGSVLTRFEGFMSVPEVTVYDIELEN